MQDPMQGGRPPIQCQPQPVPQPPQKSGGFGGGGMQGFVVALLVALAVSYGMLQFMGVPKSEMTGLQNTVQNTVNTFSGRITALEGRAIPPDLSVRMADVEAKVRTATAVDTSLLVSKAVYDAKVAELEAAIAAWKTTTGTTTSTTGGTVTAVTNPTNLQTLGSTQVCFTLRLQNTTSQWVYIRPTISINLHTGQSPLAVALTAANILITAGGGTSNYVDADFQAIGTTSGAQLTPVTMNGVGTGEIQLGGGQSADMLICIQVDASVPARIWDITASVNWRSL